MLAGEWLDSGDLASTLSGSPGEFRHEYPRGAPRHPRRRLAYGGDEPAVLERLVRIKIHPPKYLAGGLRAAMSRDQVPYAVVHAG